MFHYLYFTAHGIDNLNYAFGTLDPFILQPTEIGTPSKTVA